MNKNKKAKLIFLSFTHIKRKQRLRVRERRLPISLRLLKRKRGGGEKLVQKTEKSVVQKNI
jgi:hypothetical protein